MSRHRSRSLSSSSSGRAVQSNKWDGKTGYRLHVSDLAAGISRREVERVFTKFGPLNEVWVATNPPCFAFVNFTHRSDAEKALRDIDGKVIGSTRVSVSWARERTFGGRNRRVTSSSFRTRRRSRSRSRSNSRREKRRRSRSRSSDRHHRRSKSPRSHHRRSPKPSKKRSRSPDSPNHNESNGKNIPDDHTE